MEIGRDTPTPTPDHFETNDQQTCNEVMCIGDMGLNIVLFVGGTGGKGVLRGSQV